MQELSLSVLWIPVEERAGVPYLFPRPFTPFFREHYKSAAIYRWRVLRKTAGSGEEVVYIGEAGNLHQRIQRVLTPGSKAKETNTNVRLHNLFTACLAEGGEVRLDMVSSFSEFVINGALFSPSTLDNEFVRCAVESILVRLAECAANTKSLNKRMTAREMRSALVRCGLPPEQHSDFLGFCRNHLTAQLKED